MSELVFNLSIGRLHLQIGRNWPWFRAGINRRVDRPWWRVTLHEFFGLV